MPFKKNNPGCPCCDDDCRIVITGWTQSAGTWTITGDNLKTASSSALAITTNEHPEEKSTHYVSVKLKGDTDGDVLRVVVAYADANNYLYAELEVGTTRGILRMFQVTGGSVFQLGEDIELAAAKSGEWHTLRVCYDGELLIAYVVGNQSFTPGYAFAVTATGTRVGVATGEIATLATFEDFEWHIHYDDGGYYGEPNDCPKCEIPPIECTPCSDNETPRFMKVRFTGVTSGDNPECDCDEYNSTFVVQIRGITESLCQLWNNFTLGCGFSEIAVTMDWNGNARAYLNYSSKAIMFQNVYTANNIPCLDFDNTEFPFESQDADSFCDGSSAVAYVTAL